MLEPKPLRKHRILLAEYHALGRRFRALNLEKYTKAAVADFAAENGVGDDLVRKAYAFAEYPLSRAQKLSEGGVFWGHFRLLVGIKDKKDREELEERVVAKRLTVRELGAAIKAYRHKKAKKAHRKGAKGDRSRSNWAGGRKPVLASPLQSLARVTRLARELKEFAGDVRRAHPGLKDCDDDPSGRRALKEARKALADLQKEISRLERLLASRVRRAKALRRT